MKNGKWMRLGMGLCLLLSLLFLPGTGSGKGCMSCSELKGEVGYLEIHNNTIYNIQVTIYNGGVEQGPYKITSDPSFLSLELSSGECVVSVFVFPPIAGSKPVFYRPWRIVVPKNWKVKQMKITLPLNYVPIAETN
jgi:hypothetical protein